MVGSNKKKPTPIKQLIEEAKRKQAESNKDKGDEQMEPLINNSEENSEKRKSNTVPEKQEVFVLKDLLKELGESTDFFNYYNSETKTPFYISYYAPLIEGQILHNDILNQLNNKEWNTIESLKSIVPIEDIKILNNKEKIEEALLAGSIMVYLSETDKQVALIPAHSNKGRSVSKPEIEFSVIGPQDAFVEGMDININLIRKRIPSPKLTVKEITVGKVSKTKVSVVYIDGIANEQNVNTVTQRLNDIEFDQILDISTVEQLLQDNSNSPFPQLISTERPDRVAAVLGEGKVAIVADGSNHVITGPTTFIEFFSSMEDYYMSWLVGSAFRLIRFLAVTFSIFATPIYVAVLTFHYELIPRDLLATLTSSRANIPFPPVFEAIFLELTIELLREAGARLPTKVGQTIGIVGGIVIGQASVEAGLTSNILLIIVALAALASFTTPVYQMGSTIRLLRFPFIFFAYLWGGLGIVICLSFLMVHLLKLTSLGNPYMSPLYPIRLSDWKDAFIRLPFSMSSVRPFISRAKDAMKYNNTRVKEKNDNDK
jgi:hypothetical protein